MHSTRSEAHVQLPDTHKEAPLTRQKPPWEEEDSMGWGGKDADADLGRWASLPGQPPATSLCVFGIACLGPGPSLSVCAGWCQGSFTLLTIHVCTDV